jgi:heat shock protein 5
MHITLLWPPTKHGIRVVSKDDRPVVKVTVSGSEKTFTPEEISAMVLGKVR